MASRHLIFLLVLPLVAAAGLAAKKKPVITNQVDLPADTKEWDGTVPAGMTFEVKWVTGNLNVSDSPDENVHLDIEQVPGTPSPTVQVLEHDGGITLCTIYPPPKPNKVNQCVPGDAGTLYHGFNKKAAKTNLTVSLPRGVKFAARAQEGEATSTFSGDAVFDIFRSNITLTAGTNVEASNVSGTIRATLKPSEVRRKFKLRPMNDTAEVTLLNVPVRIEVKGTAEKIRSHVHLKVTNTYGTVTQAEGESMLGEGAVLELNLSTINGELIVRRSRM